MVSAISAVEAAAYTALAAGVTLANVYQHAPQDAAPPFVIIGDMAAEPFGTKGSDPDRIVALEVGSFVLGEAREPLLDLQEEVETALDGLTVTYEGWTLQFTFTSSDGALLEEPPSEEDEGGVVYAGASRFRVMALSN